MRAVRTPVLPAMPVTANQARSLGALRRHNHCLRAGRKRLCRRESPRPQLREALGRAFQRDPSLLCGCLADLSHLSPVVAAGGRRGGWSLALTAGIGKVTFKFVQPSREPLVSRVGKTAQRLFAAQLQIETTRIKRD
jgi:hypothetical protein